MHLKAFWCALVAALQFLSTQGKIQRYTLNISYFSGSPDGVYKHEIFGINGQFPGPKLEATEGDTMEILVINNIQDGQNTSIHWHGIHQKGSVFEDGPSQITQCPLPAGGRSQTYRFKVDQSGTYWYHSHQLSQYTEGLYGPLIIHAKKDPYIYDDDLTILLSDWFHPKASEIDEWVLANVSNRVPPIPDAGIINGMGRYPCEYAKHKGFHCESEKQQRPVFNLEQNKTYRIRTINAGAVAAFNFSIDGHKLHTIEVDGVDVRDSPKVYSDIVNIAAGQRYSFLFRCDNESKNGERHLIRANMRTELILLGGDNINKYPKALLGDVTGVIRCWDGSFRRSNKIPLISSENFTWNDKVPSAANFRNDNDPMVYLDEMELTPFDKSKAPDPVDLEFRVDVHFEDDHENIRRGSFNNSPFVLPQNKPLLMTLLDGEDVPNSVFPLEMDYGNVVQLVINNPFSGPHPFHLHGHHFWVVGMGKMNDGNFTGDDGVANKNLTLCGVKRDTVVVEQRSWVVIRFVADNPGVWLFHCHMDWHNLSGMSLVFVEGKEILRQKLEISSEAARVCKMHNNDDDK